VAELETTFAACRRDNGRLRTRRAQELARNHALTADLHSRDLTIVNLRADIAALHGEKTASQTIWPLHALHNRGEHYDTAESTDRFSVPAVRQVLPAEEVCVAGR
jgi:hypothetical protein